MNYCKSISWAVIVPYKIDFIKLTDSFQRWKLHSTHILSEMHLVVLDSREKL